MAPAVAPHPDADLVQSAQAAVAPIQLCVGGGASKTLFKLQRRRNSGATVAANEARNEGCTPQHVLHVLPSIDERMEQNKPMEQDIKQRINISCVVVDPGT